MLTYHERRGKPEGRPKRPHVKGAANEANGDRHPTAVACPLHPLHLPILTHYNLQAAGCAHTKLYTLSLVWDRSLQRQAGPST